MTIKALVRPCQRKLGLLCVVESPERPAIGIMTNAARRTQPAFVPRVFVAGLASKRRILEPLRAVTFFARNTGMEPNERKPCHVVVKFDLLAPTGFLVTLLAFRTKLALMRVAFRMAARARHWQLILVEIAQVAGFTFRLGVQSPQREFRCLVVIKVDDAPFLVGVTRVAFGAVFPGVFVLQSVTRNAGEREPGIPFSGMATGADNLLVRTKQREFRFGVVKGFCLPPHIFIVALVAGVAEPVLMRISQLVTVHAAAGSGTIGLFLNMAADAGRCAVRTLQVEVCHLVIKSFSIKQHDLGIAAFVIGMTDLAVSRCGIAIAAVKAF
ncbi:MAG: hypothetical protein ABL901_00175 [Hyphomicrobiaceae bacterium]